jgi:hypothetical protein
VEIVLDLVEEPQQEPDKDDDFKDDELDLSQPVAEPGGKIVSAGHKSPFRPKETREKSFTSPT